MKSAQQNTHDAHAARQIIRQEFASTTVKDTTLRTTSLPAMAVINAVAAMTELLLVRRWRVLMILL